MALIGSERTIRCKKCQCIEFIEQTVITMDEESIGSQLQHILKNGLAAPQKKTRIRYICLKCGEELK